MYENGYGVLENHKTAVKWYILSAEQGNVFAQDNLGSMYENGHGILKDYEQAYMWYTIAASSGDDVAAKNKERLGKTLTSEQIIESQKMVDRCLASIYTNC